MSFFALYHRIYFETFTISEVFGTAVFEFWQKKKADYTRWLFQRKKFVSNKTQVNTIFSVTPICSDTPTFRNFRHPYVLTCVCSDLPAIRPNINLTQPNPGCRNIGQSHCHSIIWFWCKLIKLQICGKALVKLWQDIYWAIMLRTYEGASAECYCWFL